ncbi:MAG TPA: N-acetylmuramoyl-L-alanine amidase [Verrucomicrobiota bacterium]|nr:N-acetylmuramoyl-L-alanine amidase [Verrucomicrobiota bacterium]
MLSHNTGVPKSDQIALFLAFVVAGCATSSSGGVSERVPNGDRREEHLVPLEPARVSEGPVVAAPVPPAPPARGSALPADAKNGGESDLWISLARWVREGNASSLMRKRAPEGSWFLLTGSNGVFSLKPGTLAARWNGTELRLGFEPILIDNVPFVHALDLKKNIEPLLHAGPLRTRPRPVIVVDAGHGGANGGTTHVTEARYEKEYTLDLAKRLEPLLAASGWTVFLTRTNDSDMSLQDRVAFAEQKNADLFVSLHFNSAAPSREQSGLETFCLTPAGMASTLTRGYEDNPDLVFANNSFDAENLQYAMLLHRALLEAGGFVDRGVRRARFLTVLRGHSRPAVLLEAGYLSNPQEAARIADPAFRQRLAEAIAGALEVRNGVLSRTVPPVRGAPVSRQAASSGRNGASVP